MSFIPQWMLFTSAHCTLGSSVSTYSFLGKVCGPNPMSLKFLDSCFMFSLLRNRDGENTSHSKIFGAMFQPRADHFSWIVNPIRVKVYKGNNDTILITMILAATFLLSRDSLTSKFSFNLLRLHFLCSCNFCMQVFLTFCWNRERLASIIKPH